MRILIVGGGERGLALAARLRDRGDAARVVTRDERRRARIEAVGAECLIGDPDRIGTLRYACENVTGVVWALGCASGDTPERLAALHDSRLSMMLERTIDTTVRAFVYEHGGTLPQHVRDTGAAVVTRICERNEIPFALLDADGTDPAGWAEAAERAILELLAQDRG